MKLEVRKVKVHKAMSRETIAFNGELWRDGVKIADLHNDGGGGPNWLSCSHAMQVELEAFCSALPAVKTPYGVLDMNLDFWISTQVGCAETIQKMERLNQGYWLIEKGGGLFQVRRAQHVATFPCGTGERVLTPAEAADLLEAKACE